MNPKDVFPRRNLPGTAEEWGRAVEDRIREIEYAATNQRQELSGVNRTSASSLQELSRQLRRLEDLYRAIPKPAQATATATNFGLGSGWNTVVSASLVVPAGSTQASILATGSGSMVASMAYQTSSRLVISGTGGPEARNPWHESPSGYRTIMVPTQSRSFSVSPGSTISVQFQVQPLDTSSFPADSSNYATLSLIGTFTG